jgi:predicted ATPase
LKFSKLKEVLSLVARALHIEPAAVSPTLVGAALRRSRVLLVLDNMDDAPAVSQFLQALRARTSSSKLIVTSSVTPPGAIGGDVFTLDPLEVPEEGRTYSVQELARVPAVALYVRHTVPTNRGILLTLPTLDVIGQLCRALDGLPLAIELAAHQYSQLPPEAVLERLREEFVRTESQVRAGRTHHPSSVSRLVEPSYASSAPEAQRLLRNLAVMTGTWDFTAAHAVGSSQAFDTAFRQLLQRHLIQDIPNGRRYRLLHIVSNFARGIMDDKELRAAELRHARHFCAVAADLDPVGANHPFGSATAHQLALEEPNITAALGRLEACGHTRKALEIAASMARYWYVRGLHRSEYGRLRRLLVATKRIRPSKY